MQATGTIRGSADLRGDKVHKLKLRSKATQQGNDRSIAKTPGLGGERMKADSESEDERTTRHTKRKPHRRRRPKKELGSSGITPIEMQRAQAAAVSAAAAGEVVRALG